MACIVLQHLKFPSYRCSNGLRVAVKRGSTLYHLHGDPLGSTSLTTCGSFETASRADYAYGAERSATGDLQTDHTFTGQKADASGLLYYNARDYDPALGTFDSPDSVVPGAGNVTGLVDICLNCDSCSYVIGMINGPGADLGFRSRESGKSQSDSARRQPADVTLLTN